MCNMILNQEFNGVELYFDNKPIQQTINNLKSNGFRWSGFKKCWYAKQNEKTLKVAEEMAGIDQESTTEEIKITSKKQSKNILSLWERIQFKPGTADTSKYNYKYVGSNYTGLTTKETAKVIRQHLKARFPEVKFSVTSDYHRIDVEVKKSPYSNLKSDNTSNLEPWQYEEFGKEHNPELTTIREYCRKLVDSYNFDDSDSQSDYFHCHYYDSVTVDYDYTQTEQTEAIKADIIDFRNKLEQEAQAEEERKEQEYQVFKKQQEEQEKSYQARMKEEAKEVGLINNSIDIKNLEEQKQYFVIGSQFAHLNKNDTLNKYKEEVTKGEHYLQDVKITKEVHFQNKEALEYFSNLLLNDFDFLSETGGSFTDDVRIDSMTDYHNMSKEERETVIFNLYGVAIYYNNELQFIVDAQGYNYARYVGLVDGVKIQKELNIKQFINPEQLEELKIQVETLINFSTEAIICDKNLANTWNKEDWNEYKTRMKQILNKNYFKLTKEIIQQIPEDMDTLKSAMYKLLTEIDSIQEQFKNANLQQGQKLTLFYISDFGGIVTSRITFDSVEHTKYAQHERVIKLIFKPENKRKLYYNYFYSTLLVYNGWLELPEEVLNTVEKTGTGTTLTKTKYLSCDKKQYDEILNYFATERIRPIVNTYKPVF